VPRCVTSGFSGAGRGEAPGGGGGAPVEGLGGGPGVALGLSDGWPGPALLPAAAGAALAGGPAVWVPQPGTSTVVVAARARSTAFTAASRRWGVPGLCRGVDVCRRVRVDSTRGGGGPPPLVG